jgi:hypothetical protein
MESTGGPDPGGSAPDHHGLPSPASADGFEAHRPVEIDGRIVRLDAEAQPFVTRRLASVGQRLQQHPADAPAGPGRHDPDGAPGDLRAMEAYPESWAVKHRIQVAPIGDSDSATTPTSPVRGRPSKK